MRLNFRQIGCAVGGKLLAIGYEGGGNYRVKPTAHGYKVVENSRTELKWPMAQLPSFAQAFSSHLSWAFARVKETEFSDSRKGNSPAQPKSNLPPTSV